MAQQNQEAAELCLEPASWRKERATGRQCSNRGLLQAAGAIDQHLRSNVGSTLKVDDEIPAHSVPAGKVLIIFILLEEISRENAGFT
ncbi:MAG: hypothetical protein QUV06_08220 [Cyanobium sp. CZS 48M]|nr:hypothetical protein [Cyanobium sp. CZS48M]